MPIKCMCDGLFHLKLIIKTNNKSTKQSIHQKPMKHFLHFLIVVSCILGIRDISAQTATQVSVTGVNAPYSIGNNVATPVEPDLIVSANGNIPNFTVSITGIKKYKTSCTRLVDKI
jgi:hypothetical protein